MMSIPFFGLCLGFAASLGGSRTTAMICWALSVAALLLLFRQHATDALAIAL